MATVGDMTEQELRKLLEEMLKPMQRELTEVRKSTNQMYDALESHGLPLPKRVATSP